LPRHMIPRALRGLRGRLLLALVATSAVTLAVAAAVTLSPLRERLRQTSINNLRDAVVETESPFSNAMSPVVQKYHPPSTAKTAARKRQAYEAWRDKQLTDANLRLFDAVTKLRARTA